MGFTYRQGNIFESGCQVLVNPVNWVGVMGAGLAAQFKQRYPENFEVYKRACKQKYFHQDEAVLIVPVFEDGVDFIVNFPTKIHWKEPSTIELIRDRLLGLWKWLTRQPEQISIAIPALGCGLGGLDWSEVKPVIEDYFEDLAEYMEFVIYEPN